MHVDEQPPIDLVARARMAVYALATMLVVSAGVIVSDIVALALLDDVALDPSDVLSDDFGASSVDAAERFDLITGVAGLVEFGATILTAIFFLRWFNGAHRRLDGLAPGVRRHKTWWSIGGWFIPFMGFFRPKQILDDMLTCIDGEPSRPWWASTWWALWLIGSFGGNFVARAFVQADTVDELRDGTIVDACTSAVLLACAVAAIVVVRRVTAGLERKGCDVAARPRVGPQPLPALG